MREERDNLVGGWQVDLYHVTRHQNKLPRGCYLYSRGHAITFPNAVIVGCIDDCPTAKLEGRSR